MADTCSGTWLTRLGLLVSSALIAWMLLFERDVGVKGGFAAA